MTMPRIGETGLLVCVLAASLAAQSGNVKPEWETLMRAPIPDYTLRTLSVLSLPSFPPAPEVPRDPGPGHTHAGPVFGYILHGAVEIQVEPDLPGTYKTGEVFSETPMHLHRYLRNASKSDTASVLIFQTGDASQRAAVIKLLIEAPFEKAAKQEVSLLRLTLPAGAESDASPHAGPGIAYVLEGTIEVSSAAGRKTYGAGEVFLEPAGRKFKNASGSEPAKLLLYQENDQR
jgi:quercetin dioxygenase-like cupin family protein